KAFPVGVEAQMMVPCRDLAEEAFTPEASFVQVVRKERNVSALNPAVYHQGVGRKVEHDQRLFAAKAETADRAQENGEVVLFDVGGKTLIENICTASDAARPH